MDISTLFESFKEEISQNVEEVDGIYAILLLVATLYVILVLCFLLYRGRRLKRILKTESIKDKENKDKIKYIQERVKQLKGREMR